jgi:hypothetical protein
MSHNLFLQLYHNQFKHKSQSEIIERRISLLALFDGDIFHPIQLWPRELVTIFWKKPMTDMETFKFFIFIIGNGGSPDYAAEWILTSQYWSNQRSAEKRARQLDWIYENKETKASTWFYYDLVHNDWRFLNGIKRYISN